MRRLSLILLVALAGCGSQAHLRIDAHNAKHLVVAPAALPTAGGDLKLTIGGRVVPVLPSPNGKWMLRAAPGAHVELRSIPGGAVVDTLSVFRHPVSLAWSADSTTFAVGDMQGLISVWDEFAHRTFDLVGVHAPVTALALSPDKRLVASAYLDRTVRIWDARTHKQVATVRLSGVPSALRFSPDAQRILADDTQRAWQLRLPR